MLIITTGIIINILLVIVLLIGLFHSFEKPKHKAVFGYTVTASMLIYILLLCFIAIYSLFVSNKLYSMILFLSAIFPFIIGKLASYKTLKIFTIIQILCCLFSLIILLILL